MDSLQLLFKIVADSSVAQREVTALRNTISKEVATIKSAATEGFGGAESSVLSMGSAFKTVGVGLAAFSGIAVAAAGSLFALVKSTADAGAQIYDLSVKTGFSASTLSALKNAAEASGSSLEKISASLGIFDKNVSSAERGSAKMSATFKALNIDISSNEKALRSAFEQLSKMPAGAEQTAAAMALFGKSGKDVLGVIEQMHGDLDGAIARYKELGTLIDGPAAAAANKFRDDLKELQQQLAGMAREIGMTLMPTVENAIHSLSGWLRDNKNTVLDWTNTFVTAIKNLSVVVGPILGSIIEAIKTLNNLLKAAGGNAGGLKDQALGILGRYGQMLPQMSPEDEDAADPSGAELRAKFRAQAQAEKDKLYDPTSDPFNPVYWMRQSKPTKDTPHLQGLGKTPKPAREKKGADDFGQQLLDQLNEQLTTVAEKTKLAETATQLLEARYKGLSSTLKNNILHTATLIDLQKQKDKEDKEQARLTDLLKGYVDKQTEAVRSLYLGQKDNYSQGEELIDSLKRQGLEVKSTTETYIHLNDLLLDVGASMKALEKLKLPPDFAKFTSIFEGENKGDKFKDFNAQMNAAMGGLQPPPAMKQSLDVFSEFSKVMGDTFGLGKEQAQEFGNILSSTFGQVANSVGDAVEAFVKFGKANGSFSRFAVEVIASVARMAVVQAVFEGAEALAMYGLYYFTQNPDYLKSATAHGAAAIAFAAVGGVATIAGRGLAAATGYGKEQNGAAAGTALRNSASGGGSGSTSQPIDTGRTVANSQIGNVLQKLTAAVNRLSSASPGDVLIAGAQQRPEAVGNAFVHQYSRMGRVREVIINDGGIAAI